jgi:hypothetical protein
MREEKGGEEGFVNISLTYRYMAKDIWDMRKSSLVERNQTL